MKTVFLEYDKESGKIFGARPEFTPMEDEAKGVIEITEEVWRKIRMSRGKQHKVTVDTIRANDAAEVLSSYEDLVLEVEHVTRKSKTAKVKEKVKNKQFKSLTVNEKWDLVEVLAMRHGLLNFTEDEVVEPDPVPDPVIEPGNGKGKSK